MKLYFFGWMWRGEGGGCHTGMTRKHIQLEPRNLIGLYFPYPTFLYRLNATQLQISMVVIHDISQFHNTSQTCIHKLGSY